MAQIDPNIAMGYKGIKLDDPIVLRSKVQDIQRNQQLSDMADITMGEKRRGIAEEATLNDLYRGAVSPTGELNRNTFLSGLAARGLGHRIPAQQKGFAELDKSAADTKKVGAETSNKKLETLHTGLKYVDSSIASMLADPNIDDRKVAGEMGRLVRLGAFDAQAEHMNVTPDEAARQIMSTMPVGNPAALRTWLTEAGMRTAEASKRLELTLPKYDEQDRGGSINEGTINPMTGVRTSGTNQAKGATPGDLLVNARASDANAINKEAQRSQIVQTPDGYMIVDKGTKTVTPLKESGTPILPADSKLAEDRKMVSQMKDMSSHARKLLESGPTESGVGALADKVMAITGQSTKGMDAAASLDTLSGWMTSNVPRMQGPQGVQDVILYKQMAGIVGDRTQPVTVRLAALDTVDKIMDRQGQYTGGKPPSNIPTPGGRPPIESFRK